MEHPAGRPARELFGQIAVRRGFVSPDLVHEALKIQAEMVREGGHPLIGIILMELGMLSTTEMIEVLKEIHQRTRRMALAALQDPGR